MLQEQWVCLEKVPAAADLLEVVRNGRPVAVHEAIHRVII